MKRTKRYMGVAAICVLALLFSGCSIIDNWGEAEVKVDFGQYQNTVGAGGEDTSEPQTGVKDPASGQDGDESGAGEQETDKPQDENAASDSYEVDEELMAEFYKSEFSEELMAYFEANGRGEEAFSQPIFDSENKIYSKEELDQLSDIMCKIFRNEIYARHGMIFGDEDLNQLYGPFSWYEGTISLRDFEAQEELPFNATEYANIKNVVAVEKARKE